MPSASVTLLRIKRYSGRLRRAICGTGLTAPLVFMHMPKCGGTSLSEALYAAVPIHRRIGVIDALATRRAASLLAFGKDCPWQCHDDLAHGHHTFAIRHAAVLNHMCWDTTLIHGHVQFRKELVMAANGHYGFATVLRDPTSRMISNFRMAQKAGLCSRDFSAYLDTPLAAQHARMYLRYLSGINAPSQDILDQLTEQALLTLDGFDLIGTLERLKSFANAFCDLFGARLHIPKLNAGQGILPNISTEDAARMTALLRHDQRIYDYAQGRGC